MSHQPVVTRSSGTRAHCTASRSPFGADFTWELYSSVLYFLMATATRMTLFRGRRQLIGWTMDIGHRPTARRKDANIIDVAGHTTLKEQRQSQRQGGGPSETPGEPLNTLPHEQLRRLSRFLPLLPRVPTPLCMRYFPHGRTDRLPEEAANLLTPAAVHTR